MNRPRFDGLPFRSQIESWLNWQYRFLRTYPARQGIEYYLWAAVSTQITANTNLAVAPLPNIGSGKICFGKNEVPETHPSTLSDVWKLIFDTPFNADHTGDRCHSEPDDIRDLLSKLAADKVKKFPKSDLILSTTTIEDAWETIVEQRRYDSRF